LSLKFPASLEDRFNRETQEAQIHSLTHMGIIGILLFNVFLITDFTLVPVNFWRCVAIRLLIFTPAASLTIVVGRISRSTPQREFAKLVIMTLTGACALAVGSLQAADSALFAQINLILVLAFGNLILRLRWPFALVLNLIWIAEDALYLTRLVHFNQALRINCLFIFINFAATTLFVAHRMENKDRKLYLLLLREQLRNSELAQINRDLAHLSTSDPLTGLANRRQLDRRLNEIWDTRSPRNAPILSVILADLDHFKRINDTYGHLVGDRILTVVADSFRSNIRRPEDLIARFGGEEFVVILPNVAQARAVRIAERLRCEIRNTRIPTDEDYPPIQLSVSLGVATAPLTDVSTAQTLLEQADLALYQAKQAGRDRVAIFAPAETRQLLAQ